MSNENKPVLPIIKILGVITLLILVSTVLLSWLSSSSMLYEYTDVSAKATVVEVKVADQPENLFFSMKYADCKGVTESINLGKRTLAKKAPQALRDIRTCLNEIKVGQEIEVKLTTRRQRLSGTRAGRINQVGSCEIPLLPTHVQVSDKTRCS